ncbi:hypothetical protein ATU3B_00270 [Agrobacterium genomosp. 3 str. CIP 111-78]|uniref:Uncharacterized protein n=1 Tax=Agrobacterium tumefaciens TaxID=358 RepID=A0AAE6BTV2_AGRTU|nr:MULTISPECIES: hypothetical protein [Agrobacterium tumefaciens complex]MCA2370039.1 hypothetical protein [Agrobacterium tomkonis CIP 111-78]QCM03465.1 hypothetical protein CFBP6624_24885 [Agrobacterium tumefaciens]
MLKQLEPYLTQLYPIMYPLGLPWTLQTAALMAVTILLGVLVLVLFLMLPGRRRAAKATAGGGPDKATLKLAIASRLEVVNSQNARIIAEQNELYRALGAMLDERPPNNHREALEFLEEHRAIFALMIEALQEGSPQWASKAKGEASVLHYLYDLVDAALRSSNDYVRSQRDFSMLSAYAKHSREHSTLMSDSLQTVITPPNQNGVAIIKPGAITPHKDFMGKS